VAAAGVDGVDVRCGDGLATLRAGEVDTVIMGGMGGRTMLRILATPIDRGIRRLVLQPATHVGLLRGGLTDRGWGIVAETLTDEDGRLFLTLAVDAGAGAMCRSEADRELGPILRAGRGALFLRWLASEERRLSRLLESVDDASARAELGRRHEMIRRERERGE